MPRGGSKFLTFCIPIICISEKHIFFDGIYIELYFVLCYNLGGNIDSIRRLINPSANSGGISV